MIGCISYVGKEFIKQIINTWNLMIIKSHVNVLCIYMKIIYMVRQWLNIYLMLDLNG